MTRLNRRAPLGASAGLAWPASAQPNPAANWPENPWRGLAEVQMHHLPGRGSAQGRRHHDETSAFPAAGCQAWRSFRRTDGFRMRKPAPDRPSSINGEQDLAPAKRFTQDSNGIITRRQGGTVLGRNLSAVDHGTCAMVSEVKRNIIVEASCALNARTPEAISAANLTEMGSQGDRVMHPALIDRQG